MNFRLSPLVPIGVLAFSLGLGCGEKPVPRTVSPIPPVNLEVAVDHGIIRVGDILNLRIVVNRDRAAMIEQTDFGSRITDFDILDVRRPSTMEEKGRVIETEEYKLQSRWSGSYQIPPLSVNYQFGSDTLASVSSSILWVEVKSHGASETGDIKGLKPIKRGSLIHFPWRVAGIVAGLLAVLFLIFKIARRHREVVIIPPPPPDEWALGRLAEIDCAAAWRNGQGVETVFQLSEIFREYLSLRYQMDLLEMTTEEILKTQLPEFLGELRESVQSLFFTQDRVKFARLPFELSLLTGMVEEIRRIIVGTRKPMGPEGRR